MNIKELTNKELIKLYKEHKCSLQAIEKDLGLTKIRQEDYSEQEILIIKV